MSMFESSVEMVTSISASTNLGVFGLDSPRKTILSWKVDVPDGPGWGEPCEPDGPGWGEPCEPVGEAVVAGCLVVFKSGVVATFLDLGFWSSPAFWDLLLFLLGRGVLVLIGDVGEDDVKKFLIEGWYVLSLLALLDAALPFFVGDADLGLCGERTASGLPSCVGRLCALSGLLVGLCVLPGLLDGGVAVVETIQGVKFGLRADARALSSPSGSWPHLTLLAGVALPTFRVPVIIVEAAEVALSLAAAELPAEEDSLGSSPGLPDSGGMGWKWVATSESGVLANALASNIFCLRIARLTGVLRSVIPPISKRLIGY